MAWSPVSNDHSRNKLSRKRSGGIGNAVSEFRNNRVRWSAYQRGECGGVIMPIALGGRCDVCLESLQRNGDESITTKDEVQGV